MANIVNFNQSPPQYLQSVNTPDYEGDVNILINPDLSSVSGVPIKYWKLSGKNVVEMDATEKQAIDDAELQQRKDRADTFEIPMRILIEGIIAAGNTQWSKGNTITKQQVIDWLKNNIT